MKRVVTIWRSLRKVFGRGLSIVARIAEKNFRACERFVARLRVSPVAENITAAISIRGFDSNSRRRCSGLVSNTELDKQAFGTSPSTTLVMSSNVQTSLNISVLRGASKNRNSQRFLDSARNDNER